jgi:hypothetical protein
MPHIRTTSHVGARMRPFLGLQVLYYDRKLHFIERLNNL